MYSHSFVYEPSSSPAVGFFRKNINLPPKLAQVFHYGLSLLSKQLHQCISQHSILPKRGNFKKGVAALQVVKHFGNFVVFSLNECVELQLGLMRLPCSAR
ncbi:hypothetical protein WH43_12490 [Rheinheimera sp. KL1]|nr:hypothetical protein WH43_12490 [Rheinheimera sp. KL1]